MDRNPRTVFQLESPYTEVQWPLIDAADQESILELLVSLLTPIGRHRALYLTPSIGKRDRKRKRKQLKQQSDAYLQSMGKMEKLSDVPPKPEITSSLLVGLASITRHLESLSRRHGSISNESMAGNSSEEAGNVSTTICHLAAIFVCRTSQSSILNAQLPQLLATASVAHKDLTVTRLVQLPKGCETRLGMTLGLPRVGFLALRDDAPNSHLLVKFIRDQVPAIDVFWLRDAQLANHQPLEVEANDSSIS